MLRRQPLVDRFLYTHLFYDHAAQHKRDSLLHQITERILSLQFAGMHIKILFFFHIVKDQDQCFIDHPCGKQRLHRRYQLFDQNPFQQIIFILKMIIKRRPDNSCLICNLLDCDFLNRLLTCKFFKTGGQQIVYGLFIFFNHSKHPRIVSALSRNPLNR